LGVSKIVPIITSKVIVNLRGNISTKLERWNKIARNAFAQSQRVTLPSVEYPIHLSEALKEIEKEELTLVFFEGAEKDLKSVLKERKSNKINIFIGPEGSFTLEEIKEMEQVGGISVRFGSRILRVETAALAALSVIMYELEF
jgi:16S rRNA (uracil1498-N3)-methyltransferase